MFAVTVVCAVWSGHVGAAAEQCCRCCLRVMLEGAVELAAGGGARVVLDGAARVLV